MIKETLDVEATLAFLNELTALDPKAMEALVGLRAPCNEALLNHPTVQVTDYHDDKIPRVGILGLLNGLFGTYEDGPKKGWGPIAAYWEKDGTFKGFRPTIDKEVTP
jgi:hypothetical protein